MRAMKQYCRYCSEFVTGNGNWCAARKMSPTDEYAKRVNKCKLFIFNPIDAFDLERTYRPRHEKQQRNWEQMKLEIEE